MAGRRLYMLGRVFSVMVIISVICATLTGNMQNISSELVNGAKDAVTLSLSLMGMMCFWNGIMKVFDAVGVTQKLTVAVKPVMMLIYSPHVLTGQTLSDICASFTANFLGLGNAALPLGIKAVKSIKKSSDSLESLVKSDKTSADADMIMFAVLNTVPFQLVPSTLIALRTAYGSENPFDILVPVWVCSLLTICFAVILCKLLAFLLDVWRNDK